MMVAEGEEILCANGFLIESHKFLRIPVFGLEQWKNVLEPEFTLMAIMFSVVLILDRKSVV